MAKATKLEVDATVKERSHQRLDLEEFRMRCHRRLSNRYRRWRFCGNPHCRRQRTCMGDATTCSSDGRPKPVRTAEEAAKIMADLQKDLKRLSAEKRVQAEMVAIAAEKPAVAKKSRRDRGREARTSPHPALGGERSPRLRGG